MGNKGKLMCRNCDHCVSIYVDPECDTCKVFMKHCVDIRKFKAYESMGESKLKLLECDEFSRKLPWLTKVMKTLGLVTVKN